MFLSIMTTITNCLFYSRYHKTISVSTQLTILFVCFYIQTFSHCSTIPTFVNDNVSLVINLDFLDDSCDVLADNMGSWRNNGVHTTHFNVSVSSIKVKDVTICSSKDGAYLLRRVYLTHSTDSSLKKLTAHIYGKWIHIIFIL